MTTVSPTAGGVRRDVRLVGVEGLRGVAAASVAVYHCWLYASPAGAPDLGAMNRVMPHLALGVTLFFTLSGFLLFRPFVAAAIGLAPAPSLRRYARNRLLRIWPAYWVILLAIAPVAALVRTPSGHLRLGNLMEQPEAFGANLLLVQSYAPSLLLTGIGPTWSLTVEVLFYAVLPALGWLGLRVAQRRRSAAARLQMMLIPPLVLLALGWSGKLVGRLLPARAEPRGWDADVASVVLRSFWGQADLFFYGMLLTLAVVAVRADMITLPRWWRGAVVITAISIGVPVADVSWNGAWLYDHLMALVCACVLALVVLPTRDDAPGLLARTLASGPFAAAGLASYSVFLWHEPLIRLLNERGLTVPGTAGFLRNIAVAGAVIAVLSAITYRFVERPTMRLMAKPTTPTHIGRPPQSDASEQITAAQGDAAVESRGGGL